MSATAKLHANIASIRSATTYSPKSTNFSSKYEDACELVSNYSVTDLMSVYSFNSATKKTRVYFTPLDLILMGCSCADIVKTAVLLTGTSTPLLEPTFSAEAISLIKANAKLVDTTDNLCIYLQGKMITNIFSAPSTSSTGIAHTETWLLNLDSTNLSTLTDPFNLHKQDDEPVVPVPNVGGRKQLNCHPVMYQILDTLGFQTKFTHNDTTLNATSDPLMKELIQLSKQFRMLPYISSDGSSVLTNASSLNDVASTALLTTLKNDNILGEVKSFDLSAAYVSYRINLLLEMNAIALTSYDKTITTASVGSQFLGEEYKFTLTDVILFWMVLKKNTTNMEPLKLITDKFFLSVDVDLAKSVKKVVEAGMPIRLLKDAGFKVKDVVDSGVLQKIVSGVKYSVLRVPEAWAAAGDDIKNNTNFTFNGIAAMKDKTNAYIRKGTTLDATVRLRLTSAARLGALYVAPTNTVINDLSIPEEVKLLGPAPTGADAEKSNVSGGVIPSGAALSNYSFPLLTENIIKLPFNFTSETTEFSTQPNITGVVGLHDVRLENINGITNCFTSATDVGLKWQWNPFKYYFGEIDLNFAATIANNAKVDTAITNNAALNIAKEVVFPAGDATVVAAADAASFAAVGAAADAAKKALTDALTSQEIKRVVSLLNKKVVVADADITAIQAVATGVDITAAKALANAKLAAEAAAAAVITAVQAAVDAANTAANNIALDVTAPSTFAEVKDLLQKAGGASNTPKLATTAPIAITNIINSTESSWVSSFYAGFANTTDIYAFLKSADASDPKYLAIKTSYGRFDLCDTSTAARNFPIKLDANLITYINEGLNNNDNNAVSQNFLPNVFLNTVSVAVEDAPADPAVPAAPQPGPFGTVKILPEMTVSAVTTEGFTYLTSVTPLSQVVSETLIKPLANSTLDKVINNFKSQYPDFKNSNIFLNYKKSTASSAGIYKFVVTSSDNKSLSSLQLSAAQQEELKIALVVRFLAVYLNPEDLSISSILQVIRSRNTTQKPLMSSRANPTPVDTSLSTLQTTFTTAELVNRNSQISISNLKHHFKYTPFQLFSGVSVDHSRNSFGQVYFSNPDETQIDTFDAIKDGIEPWKKTTKGFTGYTFREMYLGGFTVEELNKDFNVFSLMFGSFFQTDDIKAVTVYKDMKLTAAGETGAFNDTTSVPIEATAAGLKIDVNCQFNGLSWSELIRGGVAVNDTPNTPNNCNTVQGCMNLITKVATNTLLGAAAAAGAAAPGGAAAAAGVAAIAAVPRDVLAVHTLLGKMSFSTIAHLRTSSNVGRTTNGLYDETKQVFGNFLNFQSQHLRLQVFFDIINDSVVMLSGALPESITVLKYLKISYKDTENNNVLISYDLTTIENVLLYLNYLMRSNTSTGATLFRAADSSPEIETLIDLFIALQYSHSEYAKNKQYFPLNKLLTTSTDDVQISEGFIKMSLTQSLSLTVGAGANGLTPINSRRMVYMTKEDRLEVIQAYYPVKAEWNTPGNKATLDKFNSYVNLLAASNAIGDINNRALQLEVWYNIN